MLLIQILLLIFILFAVSAIIIRFKEKHLKLTQTMGWLLFWLAVAIAIILPQTTTLLAKFLGVARGTDVVVYLSIIFLFYAIFRIQIKLEKIERDITKIVQDKALNEKNLDKEK